MGPQLLYEVSLLWCRNEKQLLNDVKIANASRPKENRFGQTRGNSSGERKTI